MKLSTTFKRLKRKGMRTIKGVYMIELLMAIATSSLLSAALVSSLADTERLSTSGQNQIMASSIVQEQIDNTRNSLYDTLHQWSAPSPGETYTLLVNRSEAGQVGPSFINNRPLMLDLVNDGWSEAAAKNLFQGTVTETIIDNGDSGAMPNTLTIKVIATWHEGDSLRTYELDTLVAKDGIHNY